MDAARVSRAKKLTAWIAACAVFISMLGSAPAFAETSPPEPMPTVTEATTDPGDPPADTEDSSGEGDAVDPADEVTPPDDTELTEPGSSMAPGDSAQDAQTSQPSAPLDPSEEPRSSARDAMSGAARATNGATISGTVTVPAGFDTTWGIGAVSAYSVDAAGVPVAEARIEADGTYTLEGLSPGSYRLAFSAFGDMELAAEWWGEAVHFDDASTIRVDADEQVIGIDVTLQWAGR